MSIAKIQITPWDKPDSFYFEGSDFRKGDKVVVKSDGVVELGKVIEISEDKTGGPAKRAKARIEESYQKEKDSSGLDGKNNQAKQVLRKAALNDFSRLEKKEDKIKALGYCKAAKNKHNLQMKFVDVYFSFDGSRIIFAFIAEGRVDFRELVKDLTRHFGRTIRLQQIGIRDEAKVMGDYGHCGRELCCKKFLSDLTSITSEMAEIQQCSHRGSERISGVCGRLMCCLAYEEGGYEELAKRLMPIGSMVKIEGKKGTVVGYNLLKQTVNVSIKGENEENILIETDIKK
ncbi:MAG: regulatory iron-sulfur-containing complex subunit RicT [Patescibacteria group bacterium]|nr:regulatory iron-sulfur-containing complex subunit RicT [Patescibacteria group bacterium]